MQTQEYIGDIDGKPAYLCNNGVSHCWFIDSTGTWGMPLRHGGDREYLSQSGEWLSGPGDMAQFMNEGEARAFCEQFTQPINPKIRKSVPLF